MNEARRQQRLLQALWREAAPHDEWSPHGLAAYRANAGALAERALASAFPTVAALVGDESFAALARDFWQQHPPTRGDIGQWGDALPGFIAGNAQLASEPYLADSAALDWRVHQASRDEDAPPTTPDLTLLAHADPARLRLHFAPGFALLPSEWPVVTIWRAHHADAGFAEVRAAFDAQQRETALVFRDGFAVRVESLDPAEAGFTGALLEGRSLAEALDLPSSAALAFDQWLVRALSSRWLVQLTEQTP